MPTSAEIQQWLREHVSKASKKSIDKIDVHLPFINYGLESIEMIGLTGDLENWLNCQLKPDLLYQYPTIDQLANYLATLNPTQSKSTINEISNKPCDNKTLFPMSFRQGWLYQHRYAGLNIMFAIHVQEFLDITALKNAVNTIIERHEILRMGLVMQDQPKLFVANGSEFEISIIQLSQSKFSEENLTTAATNIAASILQEELDLTKPPLMKVVVLEKNKDESVLLFMFHHLIFDGFSVSVFVHELRLLYASYKNNGTNPLEPLTMQYSNFIDWQQKTLTGDILNKHLDYWRKKLKNIPGVFRDKNLVVGPSITYQCILEDLNTKSLVGFASQHATTPFLILLAAFFHLLHQYGKQKEIIISIVDANRFPLATKNLIGYFSNHIFFRSLIKENQSFLDLLRDLKQEYFVCHEHSVVPFGKMHDKQDEELAIKHGRILFNFIKIPDELQHPLTDKTKFLHGHDFPTESWGQMTTTESPENFRYLYLRILAEGDKLYCLLSFAKQLFNKEDAQRFIKEYQSLINLAINKPELKLNSFPSIDYF